MQNNIIKSDISVIIPVYSEEHTIGECLSSLCGQTIFPREVIVVDDGSRDRTGAILDEFQSFHLKGRQAKFSFEIAKTDHQGPGLARNFGASKARGDILVFVDGDMRFDKKYLEKIIFPILNGKAVATFTREEYVANPDNVWSKCWSIHSYFPDHLHIDPNIPSEANNFRAIKRDVFNKTKGYKDVGYGEDVTVLEQLPGLKAQVAEGAVCYHYNPSTLWEVFVSSRWMGRGETIPVTGYSFFLFSLPNSLRRGIVEAFRRKLPQFVLFKLIADFGILVGLVEQRLGRRSYK